VRSLVSQTPDTRAVLRLELPVHGQGRIEPA
jgi:hypothetical protein